MLTARTTSDKNRTDQGDYNKPIVRSDCILADSSRDKSQGHSNTGKSKTYHVRSNDVWGSVFMHVLDLVFDLGWSRSRHCKDRLKQETNRKATWGEYQEEKETSI